MSESRKMPAKKQKTKPKKGRPVEIPVPKRGEVEASLLKLARPKAD